MEIPETGILARDARNPLADEKVKNSTLLQPSAMDKPQGDWNKIQGELITFVNPELELPPIDRLEGFTPRGWCLYERVLMPVVGGGSIRPAWLYRYNLPYSGKRIDSGWYK